MEQRRSGFHAKEEDKSKKDDLLSNSDDELDSSSTAKAKDFVPSNVPPDANDLTQLNDSPFANDKEHEHLSMEDDSSRMDGDLPRLLDEPFYDEQRDEEYASELTGAPGINSLVERATDTGELDADMEAGDTDASRWIGWTALALAIVSLFAWPVFLGAVSAVTGFVAWSKGSRILGVWAMSLGLISIVLYLFLAPFNGA